MAITSYPFEGQGITEAQFSKMFRELRGDGIAASADSDAFKVTMPDSPSVLHVAPGFAFVQGFVIDSDADFTVGTAAQGAGISRTDRVVLRCDPANNAITIAVVQGANNGGTPALTQINGGIWEIPLASLAFDGANFTLTDERKFCGQDISAWSTAQRPTSPRVAQVGYNTSLQQWEYWDGSNWLRFGGSESKVAVFTSSQSWTVPDSVKRVDVLAVGGGQGGWGGGTGGAAYNGVGGKGGVAVLVRDLPVTPGESILVTIGAGGAGGAGKASADNTSGSGSFGSNGGDTQFGGYVYAPGAIGFSTAVLQAVSGSTNSPYTVGLVGVADLSSRSPTAYMLAAPFWQGTSRADTVGRKLIPPLGGLFAAQAGSPGGISGDGQAGPDPTPLGGGYVGFGAGDQYTYFNGGAGGGGRGGGAIGSNANGGNGGDAAPNTGSGGGGGGIKAGTGVGGTGGNGGSGIVIVAWEV